VSNKFHVVDFYYSGRELCSFPRFFTQEFFCENDKKKAQIVIVNKLIRLNSILFAGGEDKHEGANYASHIDSRVPS
jgi:hypothetical protein